MLLRHLLLYNKTALHYILPAPSRPHKIKDRINPVSRLLIFGFPSGIDIYFLTKSNYKMKLFVIFR